MAAEAYNLDERLRTIASMVREGAVVADIGTDHGYLIAYLVGTGRCPSGFACDLNEMPLARARETLARHGLLARVRTICADGLRGLSPQEVAHVSDIVVAGMGGDRIGSILTDVAWTRNPSLHFVLQPMTKPEHLRRQLYRSGFAIRQETAVEAAGFVYAVLSVHYTGVCRNLSPLEAWTGRMQPQTPAQRLYLERVQALLRKKAAGFSRAGHTEAAAQYADLARNVAHMLYAPE